jgi:predicted neuraminidase
VKRQFLMVDDRRFPQCHASTLAVWEGNVVAAWFAGTREGTPDNRIVLWRDGHTRVLDTGRSTAHWNPVLAVGPDGALWLFAKVGPRISEWVTVRSRSTDGGETWEPFRELIPGDRSGGRGPVKNPPIITPEGRWLAPGSRERWAGTARWSPFVDVSDDLGATWTRAPIPVERAAMSGAGLIQPALWWGPDGPVALMRSTEGRAYRSSSADGGGSWTTAVPVGLPNNNSGLAAVALPSGQVVCVHNPSAEDWGSRCPLVVSVSDDDGHSWSHAATIDEGREPVDPVVPLRLDRRAPTGFAPGDAGVLTSGVGEYSYPSVVVDGDELLCTYTWQRRGIVLARHPVTRRGPRRPRQLLDARTSW